MHICGHFPEEEDEGNAHNSLCAENDSGEGKDKEHGVSGCGGECGCAGGCSPASILCNLLKVSAGHSESAVQGVDEPSCPVYSEVVDVQIEDIWDKVPHLLVVLICFWESVCKLGVEVTVLEMSPVGVCIPEEHPIVGRVLPKAECEGAFAVVLVGRVCICAGDAVWHSVECGVWDRGAVAAL